MSRRRFLGLGAWAALGGTLPLGALFCRRCQGGSDASHGGRFGPLVPDPQGHFDLPEGFTYHIVQQAGTRMDDGYRVPGLPDGMACFPGPEPGAWVLMRNHELERSHRALGPYAEGQPPPPEAFDARSIGCVSRVVVRAEDLSVLRSHLVLAGTERNCAGGPSPWGWFSCEESVLAGHGYVFLCSHRAERLQPPRRIAAYGRFRHEAVAFDAERGIAYLTEDRTDGCFYRFVPERADDPFGPGRLQALRVVGQPRFDTGEAMRVGQSVRVEWVDLDDPDPADDTLRREAQSKGAAIVRRAEGVGWDGDAIWIAATSGGPLALGQILRYQPQGSEGGTLQLVAQAEDPEAPAFEMPDNLTVAPWGGDIVFCEDGPGTDFVRILHADGTVSDLVRSRLGPGELAGVCFSPDGSTMFFNAFQNGLTVAVRGPFPRAR